VGWERVVTSGGLFVLGLFDILRPGAGAAEAVGAVFVWRAGFLVVAGVLLRLGVLDRVFGVSWSLLLSGRDGNE
jgi:hypothetical protein